MTPRVHPDDDVKLPSAADPHFCQSVLDALPANVAVLNSDGVIVAFNQSWQQFAVKNGDSELRTCGVGVNYLDVARRAVGPAAHEAQAACLGIRSVLEGTAPTFSLEYPCHSNDQQRWFQMQVTPLQGTNPRMVVVLHFDITERKLAEESLRENERRLHAIFENMTEGIVTADLGGHLHYWNRAALAMHGFASADELNWHFSRFIDIFELSTLAGRLVPFEDWPLARLLRGERLNNEELRVRRLDKDWQRFFSYSGGIALDASGRQLVIISINDITERKATEQQVRENEERFRLMVEGVADHAIFMLDTFGNVVTWNTGAEQILGYKAKEVIGRNYSCYFPAEDVASGKPQRELEQAAAEGRIHEEGWRVKKDGSRFWSNGVLTALYSDSGALRGFAKITRDLTERQRLEALFRSVFDHASDAVITSDGTGNILLYNQKAEKLFGYSAAEVVGKNVSILMPEPHRSKHETYIADYVRTGQPRVLGTGRDVEGLRKDGSLFPAWLEVAEFFLNEQRHFIGIVRDLTEQHRTQEKVQHLAAIVESSEDAIVGISLDGVIQSWNLGAERLYGYSAAEAIGKLFIMLVLEERVALFRDRLGRAARGDHVEPIDTVRVRKDGKRIAVSARFSPVWGRSGSIVGVSAVSRDISERKKLEEQIRQAQKMEAVGQLAGGVAHDFNNLLTVINGCSEIAASNLPPEDPNKMLIGEVQKAGERAAALTRQLLAFSRKQVLEPRVLDLNGVIKDIEKLLGRLIGEDVLLTTVLNPALNRVKVDPGQIEQVILNLAVNARDAMPQGGKLTIETDNVNLDETYTTMRPEVTPGRYVMLAMSDTGCGMSPEIQSRVFEPFFTTKEPGKGTGLGLAMVYGIVKQSEGHIYLYSEPGRGTSFKIYLPAVKESISTGKSHPGGRLTLHGTETILVVEDDAAVRAVICYALQTLGYTVLEASRGTEAIRLCERHEGPIHLLVTDVVMPEMGGRQAVEHLTRLRPDLKVLYLSGYPDDAVIRHGVINAQVAFLQKPFSPGALGGKVRELLDK